jgi:hypothetical protein
MQLLFIWKKKYPKILREVRGKCHEKVPIKNAYKRDNKE